MTSQPRPHPTDPSDATVDQPKRKVDLSLSQVAGGALAAMTAAFLGSRLSVTGTLVGAGLASVVAAVAGSVYTASLRATREKVATVFTGRVGDSTVPASVETVQGADLASPAAAAPQPSAPTPGQVGGVRRPRLRWQGVLVGALAIFGLAFVALTGVELVTGHALSGGSGTTITRVTEGRSGSSGGSGSDSSPSASPSRSALPSASPNPDRPQPSATPSVTAAEPTPSATATQDGPTTASSPEPSVTSEPSADEPTPSAETTHASEAPESPAPSEGSR